MVRISYGALQMTLSPMLRWDQLQFGVSVDDFRWEQTDRCYPEGVLRMKNSKVLLPAAPGATCVQLTHAHSETFPSRRTLTDQK